jgi:hypothetical protein
MSCARALKWDRDVLRAKMVSLRLPRRLLTAYKEQTLAEIEKLDRLFNQQ